MAKTDLRWCLCGHLKDGHDEKGCCVNKCVCAGFIEAFHGGVEL
jgi:hypothetical protein